MVKPQTAAGYDKKVMELCEETLVSLLAAFGTLKPTVRLVGGLVPRYLTPENAPLVPAHAGTSDVDVVLNLQLIAKGDSYDDLAEQLVSKGFERLHGPKSCNSWQWKKQFGDTEHIVVEFLRDKGDEDWKPQDVEGEGVSALGIKHAGITSNWYKTKEISVHTKHGIVRETVHFADVPAFVILKILAFEQRREPKDVGDLIHVLEYAGTIEEVALFFAECHRSGEHADALTEGLAGLKRHFCDADDGQGFELEASVKYAEFLGAEEEEEAIRLQRHASGLVSSILNKIDELIAA